MKVCVYAIAKNESKFVDRFCDSAKDADYIAVLDTGSGDDTVQKLRDRGCIVAWDVIDPWRFDVARNKSMELIPEDTDVCLCLDLDEVLAPNWRDELEKNWNGADIGRYVCVCGRNADGTPRSSHVRDKLHKRGAVRWIYPIHEVIEPVKENPVRAYIPTLRCDHLPDDNKSRASYLPLLELAARETPTPRCIHYLGREYMYHWRYEDAIEQFMKYLDVGTWVDERAATMRYLSECHRGSGRIEQSVAWALRAVAEAPYLRENWYCAEKACYYATDWKGVCYYGERAAEIARRSDSGINEAEAWSEAVYDLLSLGYWNIGRPDLALEQGEIALNLAPDDERIANNVEWYRRANESD